MGGSNGGRVVNPWSDNSAEDAGALVKYNRGELVKSPGGALQKIQEEQKGRQQQKSKNDFFNNMRNNMKRPLVRNIGIGAASAGATAGLAALISGEREEREEEAYR